MVVELRIVPGTAWRAGVHCASVYSRRLNVNFDNVYRGASLSREDGSAPTTAASVAADAERCI